MSHISLHENIRCFSTDNERHIFYFQKQHLSEDAYKKINSRFVMFLFVKKKIRCDYRILNDCEFSMKANKMLERSVLSLSVDQLLNISVKIFYHWTKKSPQRKSCKKYNYNISFFNSPWLNSAAVPSYQSQKVN